MNDDDYLLRIYGKINNHGHLAVWCKQTKATRWFPSSDLEAAAQYMREHGATTDQYFGWSLHEKPAPHGRGTSANAFISPGVMIDVDLQADDPNVHSKTSLPASLEEVEAWLDEANIPEPSMIRHSGNGLYLDWLHSEPVFLRAPEENARYAGAVKGFHQKLRQSAMALRGWDFDATHDLARVTRMPGTFNHKTNPPKQVRIVR